MILQESLEAIAANQTEGNRVRPIYERFGFAALPDTIVGLLEQTPAGVPISAGTGLDRAYDRIVLVILDAFGWRFFEQYADSHPFLRRIAGQGVVAKLSSQFPSTTAAHMTTIHSGLPVGASGVYEWFMYDPHVDAIIAPLLFSFAGEKQRETLLASGISPEQILPRTTLYQRLSAQGVASFVFQSAEYARSSFSTSVTAGATLVPYRTFSEACVMLAQHAEQQHERAYYVVYTDTIDTIAHQHGPGSAHLAAEIQTVLAILERTLYPSLAALQGNTLLLVTADHGQIDVNPRTVVYLDQTLPDLAGLLRRNRAGQALVPAGSSRDMFLHTHEGAHQEALALLRRHLHGQAQVWATAVLIAQGYFGPQIAPIFRERVGDIVILPNEGESVWWWGGGRFAKRHRGSHGGLSRSEMETILLALPFVAAS